jgi:hypothetical protein
MAQSAGFALLEEARIHRAQAERARGLARQLSEDPAIARLEEFARELDKRAEDFERRAEDLTQRIVRTRDLAAAIEVEVESSRAHAQHAQQTLRGRGAADD